MHKIAINGFGRIGRLTLRNLLKDKEVEVVAINDLTSPATLTHLFKYDSVHRRAPHQVTLSEDSLIVDGKAISLLSTSDPTQLPWREMGVDLVLECTGIFRDEEKMSLHLQAGAKKVLLSAPAKGGNIKTLVLGVNDQLLEPEDRLVSNASCTTNCLAPMAMVLQQEFDIVKGYMTTVHAYTADQRLQDAPHNDLRRARAAAQSIIPTSTGAAKALGLVIPELDGKMDGLAMRVPTATGSVTDLTVELARSANTEEINRVMKTASEKHLKGILEYTTEPLVSSDVIGSNYSCIFDSELTRVNGNMAKVVGWYDNEAGYSARLADMAIKMALL